MTSLFTSIVSRLQQPYNHLFKSDNDLSQTCVICQDPIADVVIRVPCGHYYDKECLTNLFENSIKDETLYPARCCRRNIPLRSIQSYLTESLAKSFAEKSKEFETLNRVYCAKPTCSRFLGPQKEQKVTPKPYRCPEATCRTSTCSRCKEEVHTTLPHSCQSHQRDQEVLNLARETGWQLCPGCGRVIELNTGCYHMTCYCKTEFCYLCKAKWKTCHCQLWDNNRIAAAAERHADVELARHRPARPARPVFLAIDPPPPDPALARLNRPVLRPARRARPLLLAIDPPPPDPALPGINRPVFHFRPHRHMLPDPPPDQLTPIPGPSRLNLPLPAPPYPDPPHAFPLPPVPVSATPLPTSGARGAADAHHRRACDQLVVNTEKQRSAPTVPIALQYHLPHRLHHNSTLDDVVSTPNPKDTGESSSSTPRIGSTSAPGRMASSLSFQRAPPAQVAINRANRDTIIQSFMQVLRANYDCEHEQWIPWDGSGHCHHCSSQSEYALFVSRLIQMIQFFQFLISI